MAPIWHVLMLNTSMMVQPATSYAAPRMQRSTRLCPAETIPAGPCEAFRSLLAASDARCDDVIVRVAAICRTAGDPGNDNGLNGDNAPPVALAGLLVQSALLRKGINCHIAAIQGPVLERLEAAARCDQ